MSAPSGEAAADTILRCVGGHGNVTGLTHCFVRLRFRLRDPGAADLDTLGAHPLIAFVMWQADELHIAPRSGLFRLFADLSDLLGDTAAP